MIMSEIGRNCIDAEQLKSKKDNEMIQAYWEPLAKVKAGRVCNPKNHILNNGASAEFKKAIREQC